MGITQADEGALRGLGLQEMQLTNFCEDRIKNELKNIKEGGDLKT